jgi:hypothetical protein
MHDWQWIDDHHNCEQKPDKRPQCALLVSRINLPESEPEAADERCEQESGNLEKFAVVYAGKNIELWY